MVLNKKAISPVVATALLLVVAVVAVVGFQTWFDTFQSGQLVDVEQQAQSGSAISLELVETDMVYLRNRGTTDVNITQINVGDCTPVTNQLIARETVSNFTLSGCSFQAGDETQVSVITTQGVFPFSAIVR